MPPTRAIVMATRATLLQFTLLLSVTMVEWVGGDFMVCCRFSQCDFEVENPLLIITFLCRETSQNTDEGFEYGSDENSVLYLENRQLVQF
eukprot:TRINITY_DN4990_c0_g1_i2.p2 TRINITY_DN4990_c0_g1~~TRINITY_DN4990_c0_g1_i2.p2  ORF type:complete len:90 (+),score=11.36 TRINITY_DN4990_c0_g1_i2:16-285(+)